MSITGALRAGLKRRQPGVEASVSGLSASYAWPYNNGLTSYQTRQAHFESGGVHHRLNLGPHFVNRDAQSFDQKTAEDASRRMGANQDALTFPPLLVQYQNAPGAHSYTSESVPVRLMDNGVMQIMDSSQEWSLPPTLYLVFNAVTGSIRPVARSPHLTPSEVQAWKEFLDRAYRLKPSDIESYRATGTAGLTRDPSRDPGKVNLQEFQAAYNHMFDL